MVAAPPVSWATTEEVAVLEEAATAEAPVARVADLEEAVTAEATAVG